MSKRLISLSDLKGAMAWWAVAQHPYGHPTGLFEVIDEIALLAAGWQHGSCWFDRDGLRPWLQLLWGIQGSALVLRAWNTPKIDSGASFVAVDRYGGPPQDRDFIDIDALFMNVAQAAWDAAVEFQSAA